MVVEWARQLIEFVGTPRAIAIVLLGFSALLASTWKQLVQSLYIGLTGREWLIKASVLPGPVVPHRLRAFRDIGSPGQSDHGCVVDRLALDPRRPRSASRCPPPPGSPCASMTDRLLSDRDARDRRGLLARRVLALYGLLAWFVATPLFPRYFLAFVAILEVPLARLPRPRWRSRGIGIGDMTQQDESPRRAFWLLIGLPAVLALIEAVSSTSANRNNGTIVSSGEKREYLLYVPKSYDRREADAARHQHARRRWMAGPADEHEPVEPAGRRAAVHRRLPVGNRGRRAQGLARGRGAGSHEGCPIHLGVDRQTGGVLQHRPARIYANGLSNGGGMAFVLSCTLSDRIAAVGHGGVRPNTAVELVCGPSSGADDRVSRDGRSVHPVQRRQSWVAPETVSRASRHGRRTGLEETAARPNPVDSAVAADVTRREYTDCADDADVVLYTIHGGGHTWPGGRPLPEWFAGPDHRSIDATRQMWAFFRERRLME